MSRLCRFLLCGLMLVATAASANDRNGPHLFVGGDRTLTTPVDGDATIMAGNIAVLARVSGKLIAMGGDVDIKAPIGGDALVAGGTLSLAAPIGGDVRAMGGTVEVASGAHISGNASLAADHVHVGAPIDGNLEVGGNDIVIDSTVNGDVDATGDHIALGPNARINGRLRYTSSGELQRDPKAQVNGAIDRTSRVISHGWRRWSGSGGSFTLGPAWQRSFDDWSRPYARRGLTFLGGMCILVALLIGALLPGFSQRLGTTVALQWGWALFLGFAVLVGTPIVAAILAITIIGIPLALIVGMAWLFLLFIGYAASGVALGDIALHQIAPTHYHQLAWRVLAAVVAMVIVLWAAQAPLVGGIVSFVALLTGCGALLMQMRRSPPTPQPV